MFDELRKPESAYYKKLASLSNHRELRRVSHKLLAVPNSKNNKNSLRIIVIVAYNFAQENNLTPESIRELTPVSSELF